jgi:hypothetical protein
MIKAIIFQIVTIGVLISIQGTSINNSPIHWGDLGIADQISIISGLLLMAVIAAVGVVVFMSVWVRNGYAGLDKVLVDKEVGLFMSHVLAFILVEVFLYMVIFYEYKNFPQYAFWICGAGFLSPEAVQFMHFIMSRFKPVKKGGV